MNTYTHTTKSKRESGTKHLIGHILMETISSHWAVSNKYHELHADHSLAFFGDLYLFKYP